MSNKEIKYMYKLSVPRVRARDGESITHAMTIGFTTEEALLLSEYFDSKPGTEPKQSLIRAFLLQQALDAVDEDKLLHIMAAVYLKKQLAYDLSKKDYDRAMSFIKNPPVEKIPNPPAKTERRVFIPEPRRR